MSVDRELIGVCKAGLLQLRQQLRQYVTELHADKTNVDDFPTMLFTALNEMYPTPTTEELTGIAGAESSSLLAEEAVNVENSIVENQDIDNTEDPQPILFADHTETNTSIGEFPSVYEDIKPIVIAHGQLQQPDVITIDSNIDAQSNNDFDISHSQSSYGENLDQSFSDARPVSAPFEMTSPVVADNSDASLAAMESLQIPITVTPSTSTSTPVRRNARPTPNRMRKVGRKSKYALTSCREPDKMPLYVNGRFACQLPGCNRTFTRKCHAQRHVVEVHTKEMAKLRCPLCSYSSFRASNVDVHMEKQHGGRVPMPPRRRGRPSNRQPGASSEQQQQPMASWRPANLSSGNNMFRVVATSQPIDVEMIMFNNNNNNNRR